MTLIFLYLVYGRHTGPDLEGGIRARAPPPPDTMQKYSIIQLLLPDINNQPLFMIPAVILITCCGVIVP